MLTKKTDFPQSQSVQNGTDNEPLLFDRQFILTEGQADVKLFGNSYFVLDIGAAISADDFRSRNPGPDNFFITPLAKRVFVDLEEMKRTAFVKDIIYFLDAPNYQQALFISKENAGETIGLAQCRGLASAISLFDWNELMTNLGTVTNGVASNAKNIETLNSSLEAAVQKIEYNTENIAINTQSIAQKVIAPQNTNWFLRAIEGIEGMEYFLDSASSEAAPEISSTQTFKGGITSPLVFSGDAQIFLRAKNAGALPSELAVELTLNGAAAGSGKYILGPGGEYSTVNIKIPAIQIKAPGATLEAPYTIALEVTPESGVSFLAGGIQFASIMQFQGGGSGGGSDPGAVSTLEGDVVTIKAYHQIDILAPSIGPHNYAVTINGKPCLLNGILRRQTYDPIMAPYNTGDIIWLEPLTYDKQHTPLELPYPGGVKYPYTIYSSATSWLGKTAVYNTLMEYYQKAVRLRSMIDNNNYNPSEDQRYIGKYWAIDDPEAICEEGFHPSFGHYVKRAGGKSDIYIFRSFTAGTLWTFPIELASGEYLVHVSDFVATNTVNDSGIIYLRSTKGVTFMIYAGTARKFLVNYPSVVAARWY